MAPKKLQLDIYDSELGSFDKSCSERKFLRFGVHIVLALSKLGLISDKEFGFKEPKRLLRKNFLSYRRDALKQITYFLQGTHTRTFAWVNE